MKALLHLVIRNGRGETIAELALEPQSATQEHERRSLESSVSDAQRRMLFRLAAQLGFEGDPAREYIERRLGASPDKRTASRLIDDLQDELRRGTGGRHDRAS